MCVDFNPFHPHMLAAGLHDEHVAIYNLQKNKTDPLYISDARNGKHRDIAWQVGTWIQDLIIWLLFRLSGLRMILMDTLIFTLCLVMGV